MMKLLLLISLLSSLIAQSIALSNNNHDILKRSYKRSSYTTLYLKEDSGLDDSNDSNKQKRKIISKKLIRPEDLDNLFNIGNSDDDSDSNDIDNIIYSNNDDSINDDSDNNNNSNDNIIDNSEIPPITSSSSPPLSSSSSSSSVPSIRSRYDVSGRETDEASSSMIELGNLEKMIRLPKSDVSNEQTVAEETVYSYKSDDEIDDEVNSAYTELDRILDKDKRNSVRESMSMKESRSSSSSLSSLKSIKSVTVSTLDSPRSVQYDPTEYFRGDPMKYGAYRRWKLAEQEINNKKNSKGKRKQGKVKKEKDNNPFNPENFYDSLKKLGSGPTSKDTPTGLGVADAPNNKKPITPKKGLTKKNKKKIITPDDIDKLFETKNAIKGTNNVETPEFNEEDDEDDEDEDDEDEEIKDEEIIDDSNSLISSSTIAMNPATSFKEMVSNDEEVPKWLADADKEAKKKRAMRGKKKKRLQDDWRFWLAIIASVGFVSAFWNIYQQSGGNFDNGPASFGFGMPTIGGGGATGGGGDELVL